MGVIYLLLYIFGALFVWLGARDLFADLLEGAPILGALQFAGFGAWLIAMGALLHAVVLRRRDDAGVLEELPGMSRQWFFTALVVWLLPTLVAWMQFELFVDPIRMFPMLTVAGAAVLVLGLISHALRRHSLRWPLSIATVALIGVPLGLLTVSVPLSHFNFHLSSVKVFMVGDEYDNRPSHVVFEGDDPTYIAPLPSTIGEASGSILNALANAEEVDVSEEIAAGRMRRLEDGTLVRVNADGSEAALNSWTTFEEDFDAALRADREKAAAEDAKLRAVWEAEIEARRRGGRIFN